MQYNLPDFDTLLGMAKNDPDGLEQLRKNLTNQIIDSAPAEIRRRLHGLQFQIDARRTTSRTPMSSCIKISEMMHESFSTLRFVLNNITEQTELIPEVVNKRAGNGNIIPFHKHH